MIKLQHLFQRGRSYSSSPMIHISFKHHLFLTMFNMHSSHVTSIILLMFSNEIANIGCVALRMNFLITELISEVFIIISNTPESTSYHFPYKTAIRKVSFFALVQFALT